jgi:hypothetical protein
MATPPHLSPKLVVGIGSLLLTLAATWATMRTSGYPSERSLPAWPKALGSRLRDELPRGDHLTAAWVAVALWSVLVSGLHFGGVYYNVYTAMPWWDLMTHAMGGLGVAALLAFTFRGSTLRSPFWLVPAVFAVGAGFEVYEFLFKAFWHHWTLEFYVVDTVIDLVVNTSGSAAFAAATAVYRRRVRSGSATGDPGGDPVGTDTD